MTDYISYFNVVDEATKDHEQPFKLTSKEFVVKNDAYSWMWSHEQELRNAVEDGAINGVEVVETRILASFFVVGAVGDRSRREVPSYLGFGARIVGETEHFYVVGVAAEHGTWQRNRLGSGLHYTSRLLSTLEGAQQEALELERQLYGAAITV